MAIHNVQTPHLVPRLMLFQLSMYVLEIARSDLYPSVLITREAGHSIVPFNRKSHNACSTNVLLQACRKKK